MEEYKFPDETTPIVQEELKLILLMTFPKEIGIGRLSQRVLNLMRMN
jgi:hypothetical protein